MTGFEKQFTKKEKEKAKAKKKKQRKFWFSKKCCHFSVSPQKCVTNFAPG
jgi:hypothetical protein